MNENKRQRVTRPAVPHVCSRSFRQGHELRWRATVLRFEDCAWNVGLAQIPERDRQEEKNASTEEELSHGVEYTSHLEEIGDRNQERGVRALRTDLYGSPSSPRSGCAI